MRCKPSSLGRILGAIGVLIGGFAVSAAARMEIDDFEGGPNGGFNNPVFRHNIGPDEFFQYEPFFWAFDQGSSVSPTHSLHLSPGTDYVTFLLPAGEYVDHAQVWMRSVIPDAPAYFHALGFDEGGRPMEHLVNTPEGDDWSDEWFFVDTLGAGFGEITEVRLTGLTKGMFDDLGVNVVPEPVTLGLLGLGFLGFTLAKRRRSVLRGPSKKTRS